MYKLIARSNNNVKDRTIFDGLYKRNDFFLLTCVHGDTDDGMIYVLTLNLVMPGRLLKN